MSHAWTCRDCRAEAEASEAGTQSRLSRLALSVCLFCKKADFVCVSGGLRLVEVPSSCFRDSQASCSIERLMLLSAVSICGLQGKPKKQKKVFFFFCFFLCRLQTFMLLSFRLCRLKSSWLGDYAHNDCLFICFQCRKPKHLKIYVLTFSTGLSRHAEWPSCQSEIQLNTQIRRHVDEKLSQQR